MYAKVENGAVTRYPYTGTDVIRDNPSTSFPAGPLSEETMVEFGAVPVVTTVAPAYDAYLQRVEELLPENIAGVWTQVWAVRDSTQDEKDAYIAELTDSIVAQTQQRLDNFARTRGYDGILSACTYATSPTDKFQMEGQYCVISRDSTWAKLYQILGEVQAGTRPIPSGYADIEPELPPLVWPN